jgi:hypothetical protein
MTNLKTVLSAIVLVSLATEVCSARQALAQSRVPSGCFVTDAQRELYSGSYNCDNCDPPECFNEARQAIIPYSPSQFSSEQEFFNFYGFTYGDQILSGYTLFYKWRGSEALVQKLRKACGSRCRRIK